MAAERVHILEGVCMHVHPYAPVTTSTAAKLSQQSRAISPAVVHLNQGKERAELTCAEMEHSFGFAPSKHQLSPPISVVMSALLIPQGPEGPRLRWCTASQCSPACLERVWFLGELRGKLGQN